MPLVTAAHLALAVTAGAAGGVVNAIAGGGSLVLYPALVAIGMPSVDANVTNTVAIWPGYLGNLMGLGPQAHLSRSHVRRLLVPALLGAVIGCVLLLNTSSAAFDVIVPFLVIGAALLLAAQPRLTSVLKAEHAQHRVVLFAAVFLAAIYGGYFGGGLGVILLAVLGLSLGTDIKVSNAVKSVLTPIVNVVAVLAFAVFGPVQWTLVAAVAPAALLGGVAGGKVAARVSEAALRRIVVVFGLSVGIWLAIRAARG